MTWNTLHLGPYRVFDCLIDKSSHCINIRFTQCFLPKVPFGGLKPLDSYSHLWKKIIKQSSFPGEKSIFLFIYLSIIPVWHLLSQPAQRKLIWDHSSSMEKIFMVNIVFSQIKPKLLLSRITHLEPSISLLWFDIFLNWYLNRLATSSLNCKWDTQIKMDTCRAHNSFRVCLYLVVAMPDELKQRDFLFTCCYECETWHLTAFSPLLLTHSHFHHNSLFKYNGKCLIPHLILQVLGDLMGEYVYVPSCHNWCACILMIIISVSHGKRLFLDL